MDVIDGFISKKELLERYRISYGALYRWKRMGLIPEDWFIKRSSTTGQETFFPEREVTERIELILSKKDEISLEELSKKLGVKESESAKLVIETVYGEKKFELSDIRSVKVVRQDKTSDLTYYVKSGAVQKEDN